MGRSMQNPTNRPVDGSVASDSPADGRGVPRCGNTSPQTRVLVVDDEPLMRWSVSETLGARGYEIIEAGDGHSALLALLRTGAADAVLLDLCLPDSSDLRVLAAIKRLLPALPVILMTAHGSRDVADAALKLGAFRVLTKPFELNELAPLVQSALAASRPS